jgi:flagellar hook protein FlgE
MSSLFGALDTAVTGLSAQSAAFSNISDNVANSTTTGFKRTDTSFIDYLTTSTKVTNDSGSVIARPDYRNDVQGTITTSDNPLAMAIQGNGFFQVTQEATNASGVSSLSSQVEYTRDGDFTLDKSGYLVNPSGQALNGWTKNLTTGVLDQNQVQPIKIDQSSFSPVPTSEVTLAANLPATPSSTTAQASQINVYDAKGTLHTVSLSWTQNASDDWTVAINAPDAATPAVGGAEVKFGNIASGNAVAAGTIGSLSNATGTVSSTSYSANGAATLSFTVDFGNGPQSVDLQLGNYGGTSGVTQFAGTDYSLRGLTQNGVPPGAFSGVTSDSSGNIVVNYDNGQSRVVAQVPLIQFANPNALQREDGQAFTATTDSGTPLAQSATTGGAGTLVTGSLEGSNVDIATEFTSLIVAQRAYSANAKMVTTADDMLQQTLDMKR